MTNRFGTTEDMIIRNIEEDGATYSLAIDSKGLYLTTRDRLNSQLADPNRFASNRETVAERLRALGLDPTQLVSENQHRVQLSTVAAVKKVNPLKASKRAMKKTS